MAQEFKIYVDTKTGIVFEKPVKVNGVEFTIKKKFYEINREQADRLEDGEPMAEVLRDSAVAKITAGELEIEVTAEKPKEETKEKKEPKIETIPKPAAKLPKKPSEKKDVEKPDKD